MGMNKHHADLTKWGLDAVKIREDDTILDVGCGGGVTVGRLARLASHGKVYGIDYSARSVASSLRTNRDRIRSGQVDIRQGTVSHLPYADDSFDLVTAVETHYFWPDLPNDLREVLRVLKPGGHILIIGAAYKGSRFDERNHKWIQAGDMADLSVDEFDALLSGAGFRDIHISTQEDEGWIRCLAQKP